jgi:hypothetical protein
VASILAVAKTFLFFTASSTSSSTLIASLYLLPIINFNFALVASILAVAKTFSFFTASSTSSSTLIASLDDEDDNRSVRFKLFVVVVVATVSLL